MGTFLKPFYKTSEFWMAFFGVGINFLNLADIWNWASNWHGGILATICIAAYNVARAHTKNGVARAAATGTAVGPV